ncbi:MAG TPA: branched-chain amino acid transaminase [Candidatus Acidoferrales bacterium]|nr:branched-chain amino acid transaminase [Candidatus Acidoferrales bacterium]
MALKKTEKIWHNGEFIPWEDAQIHVLSHVVNYASAVFEGIRAYSTPKGPAVFRLQDHMQRLLNSAKVYRMDPPFALQSFCSAAVELIRRNNMEACYIRPIILRGYGDVNVNPFNCPIEVYMACWDWGKYLGTEALEQGVDVCVSTWTRMAPNTLPAMAKAVGNYLNSQLVRMEAVVNGYTEGIALDVNGYVSEGSGENIFLFTNGTLVTPPLANSVLPGITRSTLFSLAEDLGIPVKEQLIPREALYIADEVFLCGTASEVTPVRSIDHITIGKGARGPVTRRLQDEFFAIVEGRKPDRHGWLTVVPATVPAPVAR